MRARANEQSQSGQGGLHRAKSYGRIGPVTSTSWRTRWAVFLLLAACKLREERPPAPAVSANPVPSGGFIPGHVIVKMKPGASLPPEVLGRSGLVKMKDLSGGAALYRVEALDGAAPDARARTIAVVDDIKKSPGVEYAEVDQVMTFH
jgi:hypothetical protein